ncbi:MAG: hypothetical protein JXR52_08345 [Bacteroidales bacterium]|nr:hypothetical protein [Bacteroidales bacterium]MBN2698821.1 hypothetical protein [Bacteroidales bacterium]
MKYIRAIRGLFFVVIILLSFFHARAQRQVEYLNRGMDVHRISDEAVFISWRLLFTDPEGIGFDCFRTTDWIDFTKLNDEPVHDRTNWLDHPGDFSKQFYYFVRPVKQGRIYPASGASVLSANAPITLSGIDQSYHSFSLPADIISVDRIGVGDLDGDGTYDFIVKHPVQVADPGVFVKPEETYKIDAYLSDGTFLWRRDLGWNIVLGIWWSPMVVYDLDGDGRAEVVMKTAPTDVDYRNEEGRVLTGPEYFSVFDGLTGEELAREDWIPRGNISDWGDSYGNRVNRNLMCVAYLDGEKPSVIIFRGTYGLMKAEAWNFREGVLSRVWIWSNEGMGTEYQSQGFHNIRVADIDDDGKDEIINGSVVIDDDGSTIYSTGQGHGDRFVVTDINPFREGLETWYAMEDPEWYDYPIHLRDTETGELIFGKGDDSWGDVGRGLAADIDPGYAGLELWTSTGPLYSATGAVIFPEGPRYANTFVCEFGIWWDDDLLRELTQFGRLLKFNYSTGVTDRIGTVIRDNFCIADILGDWREEVIGFSGGELRIYAPTTPASNRFSSFMHDPVYRLDVATMTMGYRQSAHPGFYMGFGMDEPPRYTHEITGMPDTALVINPIRFDFGPSEASPVEEDYIQILPGVKYGWAFSDPLSGADRQSADPLLRDFITGNEPSLFQIPLMNGTYQVIVISGDEMEANETYVLINGKPVLELISEPGAFATDVFETEVDSGILDLTFYGAPWKINGLEVINTELFDYREPFRADVAGAEIFYDPSAGLLHIKSERPCRDVILFSLEGKKVFHREHPMAPELDIAGLPPGIYIVRVGYSGFEVYKKIAVLR